MDEFYFGRNLWFTFYNFGIKTFSIEVSLFQLATNHLNKDVIGSITNVYGMPLNQTKVLMAASTYEFTLYTISKIKTNANKPNIRFHDLVVHETRSIAYLKMNKLIIKVTA